MKKRDVAVAIAIVLGTNLSHAEEAELTPMVVTAPAISESSAFNGTDVSEESLSTKRASTSDTATLLNNVPGVSLNGAGGVSSLPAIHGMADDRLRVQADGMDLISACPNHMNPPLSYLDPTQVESVKVYAGITPVSVGGDSIGGTIQVNSAAPVFAQPGEGTLIKGQVGGFYRSNGHARGENISAKMASENVSLSYSGSRAQADDYKAGGDFKTLSGSPGPTIPLNVVGSTAYKTENHNLGLAVKSGNHVTEAKVGYQDIPYELYPNQRMDMLGNTERRFSLRDLGQYNWGSLEIRAYHENVQHYMNFGDDKLFWYGPLANIPGMPMNTDSKNTGAVMKANIDLSEQDILRVGAEYQRYRLNDWWPASGTTGGMQPDTFWNINGGKRDRSAAFGEWESQINPQWLSLIGARYEHVRMDTGPVDAYSTTVPADQTYFNSLDHQRTDNNWDLTALARYTSEPTRTIDFGYARKTRSPNLYELYSWRTRPMEMVMNNFIGDGNGYVGDPNLKPEVAHTLSATFDWHAADRNWEFKAAPYYTRVTDYIDAVRCTVGNTFAGSNCPVTNTATTQFVQLKYANQDARLYGIDISGRMPLASTGVGEFGMKGLLNYTNGKNLDTGDGLYNIMPLNGTLTMTHKLGGWDNGVEVVMVKGKTDISEVRNEITTPGYSLLNLRGSYSWKQASVNFGVENVFDRLYYLPTGGAYTGQGRTMSINDPSIPWGIVVPGMGRSIYTGVTVKF